ncbi:hypothetical protein HY501_00830 [Candidatus Woesearchaeota archaeon]|nr:hypothetical protein [Candidatus Woesearchaeota archaeon]
MALTKEELEIVKHLLKKELEHFQIDEKKVGQASPPFLAKGKEYELKLWALLKKLE